VYFTVLFICTGNTCRSAMAKGILEQRLKGERVMVYSAGTHDFGRMPASDGALEVAREYGADLSNHYSVPLSRYLIDNADLILCMEHRHKSRVLELSPEAASRTFMLTVYANCSGIDEIFDPVGSSIPIFRKVAEQINQCLDVVVRDVKDRTSREDEKERS
jgi:protein-tyrosine-phosphatase